MTMTVDFRIKMVSGNKQAWSAVLAFPTNPPDASTQQYGAIKILQWLWSGRRSRPPVRACQSRASTTGRDSTGRYSRHLRTRTVTPPYAQAAVPSRVQMKP